MIQPTTTKETNGDQHLILQLETDLAQLQVNPTLADKILRDQRRQLLILLYELAAENDNDSKD